MGKTLVVLVLIIAVFSSGCIGGGPTETAPPASPGNELTAIASEFKFDLSTSSVKAGAISITIKNAGTIPHEFVLYKQSDAAKVVEETAGMKMEHSNIIMEVEEDEFPATAEKKIQVNLQPGVYEIGCHLPGHYEAGMKASLNVV